MLVSIVVPVLNEADSLPLLIARIRHALQDSDWHVIFVNDGSTDETQDIIERSACDDPRIGILNFSRNFGHQAAVTAGLDFAHGDAVVVMDGDLQDPPELLPQMLALFAKGYDIVSPYRISRKAESVFKVWSAKMFYSAFTLLAGTRYSPEVGDFRLFSRRAVQAIRSLREQHRYVRGLSTWLGLREIKVPFERAPRLRGYTKYSLKKMFQLAWTAISSFSDLPLKISATVGCFLTTVGFIYLVRVIAVAFSNLSQTPGWAAILALQCFLFGMMFLAIGTIGDYVARTYEESKNRPLYVVSESRNISTPNRALTRAVILDPSPPVSVVYDCPPPVIHTEREEQELHTPPAPSRLASI